MRKMFLGGNTPNGFINYYGNAFLDAKRLFILKGGSGVGKHSFMKQIASLYNDVDYYICSNDKNSLDGIYINGLKIAIIDGTSPHTVDPIIPGCFDEIIDLGQFLDSTNMEQYKTIVYEFSTIKKKLYKRAYNYLLSAQNLHKDNCSLILECTEKEPLNKLLKSLPKTLIDSNHIANGKLRHIFASSYTSSGYTDYIDTLVEGKKTIGIKGYYCINKILMDRFYDYAVLNNLGATICHSPIEPNKIDHIIFDNMALISIDEYNKFSSVDEMLNLKYLVDKDSLLDYDEDIKWNNKKIDELIEKAVSTMNKCNTYHKKIEDIYIANMNFDKVNELRNKIIEKIDSYR